MDISICLNPQSADIDILHLLYKRACRAASQFHKAVQSDTFHLVKTTIHISFFVKTIIHVVEKLVTTS